MRNRILVLLGLILSVPMAVWGQRVHVQQAHAWIANTTQIKFKPKWGLHLEGQWRRHDLGLVPQQLLLRTGLVYHVLPVLQFTAGYAYVETYPYGAFPVKHTFSEHRFWEQVQTKASYSGWDTWLRLRLEQRFSNLPVLIGNSFEPGDAVYTNRMRVMNRWTRTLWKSKNTQHQLYWSVFDEMFVSFGKNVGVNLFDQNRLASMFGLRLSKQHSVEMGYMLQTWVRAGGLNIENNHTLNIGWFTNVEWTRLANPR